LHNQALHAYNSLPLLYDKLTIDIKTKLHVSLFDSMVVPFLLYGSEVRGVYIYNDLDNIKFL